VVNANNDMELKIQAFLNKTNSQLKEETTYTIEDAIWYAEASLNFTYAIYDSSFIYLSRETSIFSIDLNHDNTVNYNDLLETYEKMVDSLEAHYDGIQGLTKHVFLCDVIDVSNSVGRLDLKMKSVIACGYTPTQYISFGPTDYWFAGGELGKCDIYEPSFEGQDATTQLEYKLLHPAASDLRIYYENIEMVSDIDPSNYPYENAPRLTRGYCYGSGNPNDVIQCLPPNELNFYISINGIPYIIEDNDTYVDKEFCLIDVIWMFMASNDLYYETHFLNISYGVGHGTQIAASEL
jgi:hypothetical protein